jgi:hypothetical protein
MDETTEHDPGETDPTQSDADEQDPASQPASDPPPGQDEEGKEHDLEFDPQQIENDPAYHDPPVAGLEDKKGG